ncbi:MAG TPA: DUF2203 domain-containing protein [Terriglobia bacterium]|nr:DUF2203 domain-containing protein [Terriglobia bacterium]
MPDKYFDRREAEELLPTITPWLEEARDEKQKIEAYKNELALVTSRITVMGGISPPLADLLHKKSGHDAAAERLVEVINRIQETGVLVKDVDVGLVDFPCLMEDEEVYLCWKLGEDRIAFWHGIDEGFAGRKPLDDPGAEPNPPQGPRLQ